MLYYAAPMEGFTDRVWRQTHQKWFGAQGAADRYYAPFISPPENRVLIKKKMAELAPEANPGAPVIPQLLAKDGELAAWMIGQLRALGYTEVNLNLGCPAGTVTAKGKGSGMLRDLAKVDAFLDGVFSHAEGPVSVKTRLGVEKPEEFAAILEIYSRYPISELTIHPRVMRQQYRGQADRARTRHAVHRQSDVHRPVRAAFAILAAAVDRVDDPHPAVVEPLEIVALFLREQTVVGAMLADGSD